MAIVELEVSAEATQRQRAFLALALAGGNAARAAAGLDVGERSLQRWRRSHAEEYERVRRELAPQLEAVAVSEAYERVLELGRLEALVAAKLEAAVEAGEIPARDLPGALRNITTSKAINVDKILALSGRPTQVVEHRSATDIVRRLAALGAVTDASVVELPAPESAPPTESA